MAELFDLIVRFGKAASPAMVLQTALHHWRENAYPPLLARIGRGPALPVDEVPPDLLQRRLSFEGQSDAYLRLKEARAHGHELQISFTSPQYDYPEPSSFIALQFPGEAVKRQQPGYTTGDLARLLLTLGELPGAMRGYVEDQAVIHALADVRYKAPSAPEVYWLTLVTKNTSASLSGPGLIELLRSEGGSRILATDESPPENLRAHVTRLRTLWRV